MTQREAYLDPVIIDRLRETVAGDTPLMRAIRDGEAGAIEKALSAADAALAATNAAGETALFLALRTGEFDLVERLLARGAPDADSIISDERYAPAPQPDLASGEDLHSATGIDAFLASLPPVRTLTFDTLWHVRSRLAAIVEANYPRSTLPPELAPERRAAAIRWSSTLAEDGFTRLGTILNPAKIEDIRQFLASRPIYAGHVPHATDGRPVSLVEIEQAGGQGCYDPPTVFGAPHLREVANDPAILSAISGYLGCTPTLFAGNILWSFPHARPVVMGQTESIHRDYDDYAFVVLFIYLTDVDDGAGPHRYYQRTHDLDRVTTLLSGRYPPIVARAIGNDLFRSIHDGHGRLPLIEHLFADQISDVTGPAGTAFLADTYGYHRAMPPRERPRLIAWFRYGLQVEGREQFRSPRAIAGEIGDPYVNRLVPRIVAGWAEHRAAASRPAPEAASTPPAPNGGKRELYLLIDGYRDTHYNVCEANGRFYGVYRGEGYCDLDRIESGATKWPVYHGNSLNEVIAQIEEALASARLKSAVVMPLRVSVSDFDMARARDIAARTVELVDGRDAYIERMGVDPAFALPDANWSHDAANAFLKLFRRVAGCDPEMIGRLRAFCQMFSGYDLYNTGDTGGTHSLADDLMAGEMRENLRYVGLWQALTADLPLRCIFTPPERFGEIGHAINGVIVNHDTFACQERVNLLYESGVVAWLDRAVAAKGEVRILEIGGGYGALAHWFRAASPSCSYTILDLPECLLFSGLYLSLSRPDLRTEWGAAPVPFGLRFLPNYMADTLDEPFDLVVNTLSMSEMSRVQIDHYIRLIKTRWLREGGIFFEQNQDNRHLGLLFAENVLAGEFPYRKKLGLTGRELHKGLPNLWSLNPLGAEFNGVDD